MDIDITEHAPSAPDTSTSTAISRIQLEVVSDVICPWCYIGKHRLQQGLTLLDDAITVDVRWRPFELNPGMPKEGMDRRSYCERKFGSLEYANQIYATVAANAHADGLALNVECIARTPNTRAAHRLIDHAGKSGDQNAVVDALFAAYFVDGRDIGNIDVLIDLAVQAGLDQTAVAELLASTHGEADIETQEHHAHALGIDGVPAFILNGRLLFSGAQSPQTIALSLQRAVARGR